MLPADPLFQFKPCLFPGIFLSQWEARSWKQQWCIMQTLTSQLMGDKIIKRGRWIICSEALMNTHEAFRSQRCVVRWVSGERGKLRDSDQSRKAKWLYVLVGECLLPPLRWTLLAEPEHCNSAFTLPLFFFFLMYIFILSPGGFSEKRGMLWHEDGGLCLAGWSLPPRPCLLYHSVGECTESQGGGQERTLRRSSCIHQGVYSLGEGSK